MTNDEQTAKVVRYYERRIYAALIMAGLAAYPEDVSSEEIAAKFAVNWTDALIKELDATQRLPTGDQSGSTEGV